MTFEDIVAKGNIAQIEQYFLWPQCFQLYSIEIFKFSETFQIFVHMFEKSSAVDLVQVVKS